MKDCYKTASPDRYGLLMQNAREMRRKPTDAEGLLWNYLRAGRLGVKFRRQHPIGDYIADFVCLSKMLVVELDGSSHLEKVEHDELRDKTLAHLGYKTIRFTNEQLFADINSVLDEIKRYL